MSKPLRWPLLVKVTKQTAQQMSMTAFEPRPLTSVPEPVTRMIPHPVQYLLC